MKKLSLFLSALFVICFSFGFTQFSGTYNNMLIVNNQPVVPDVMGNIRVMEGDGIYQQPVVLGTTDSFPHFSGFPKYGISGQTFEGGILCNMDADADLEIVYNVGFTVQAWNYDGTNVPGWPVTVPTYGLEGSPAFGDIDGDGVEEIVVTNHGLTSGGFLHAFEKNGTAVTGFPVNHGYSSRTPVLANLDGTPELEIIINKRLSGAGEVWVYKGNGTVMSGWPKTINHVPASSAAVGDITGDGVAEVVMESYLSVYAFSANGNLIAGFPFSMPNTDVNSYSSPVLADVDNDNIREIIFGSHGNSLSYVYILKNDGSVLSGWPKTTTQWIYGPPAVGYIDGDNIIDIAVGDQVASGSPLDYIYAWNKNGTPLAGFPAGPIWAVNAQLIIADVNNDGDMELICDDNTQTGGRGKYLAFNHDGTPLAGWDVNTNGSTFFSTPMLGDVNRDGILDMAGTGGTTGPFTTNSYLWNTGVTYNASRIIIPMWQYNARHNGVYGDNPLVGVEPISNVIPAKFSLRQNYPNPFNPVTKIKFDIPAGIQKNTKLIVYDISGRAITTLFSGELNNGTYEVEWNAADYSSGVYFYKLVSGSFTETKKMILVK